MKKIMIAMLMLLGSSSVWAQKFALVDMDYILKNIPAYERASEQLKQVSKKWQAEGDVLTTEAQTLYKNYQSEAVFLSEEQKTKPEDDIVAKEKKAAETAKKEAG
jgi:outer membrane protein